MSHCYGRVIDLKHGGGLRREILRLQIGLGRFPYLRVYLLLRYTAF
jgi:hypothetical protein